MKRLLDRIIVFISFISSLNAYGFESMNSTAQPKDFNPFILEIVNALDEQNRIVKILADGGCEAGSAIAQFLDLTSSERLKWCSAASEKYFQKPFAAPNKTSPWQYAWKLNEALNQIMKESALCRANILKKKSVGAAFQSAVRMQENSEDIKLILNSWKNLGSKIDEVILERTPQALHLHEPAALELLIQLLGSPLKLKAAENLVFLTGRHSEFLVREDLSPEISRSPNLILLNSYFENEEIVNDWRHWFKQVQNKIHWNRNTSFPLKKAKAQMGLFVW